MMRKLQPAALLIGLVLLLAGPVGSAAQSPPAAASPVATPNTPCFWLDQVPAASSAVTDVQCPLTSSLAGSNTTDPHLPIALFPNVGIIEVINTWLVDHAPGYSIQQTSYVSIKTLGGQGRNGDSRPTCTSGGAGGGCAITVQQLSGMQSVIQQFAQQRYVSPTVPPTLYVFVGKEGVSPVMAPTEVAAQPLGSLASILTSFLRPSSCSRRSRPIRPCSQRIQTPTSPS
jgi:hypothetical protein